MQNRSIDELMALLREKSDYNDFFSECSSDIICNFSTYLNSLMDKNTVAALSKACSLSESYIYKLLEGKRCNPSRDTLLQICFGLSLDIEEANCLLRVGNFNILYPRIKRDSIIIFCIIKGYSLIQCDQMLLDSKEKPINKCN